MENECDKHPDNFMGMNAEESAWKFGNTSYFFQRNFFKNLGEKIDKTNHRIDVLGSELAELQDDAPTMEEFEDLGERVKKLQFKFASKDEKD